MKKTTKVFLINLVLLLLVSILNWGVVSGWGNVKIQRLTLIGDDGLSNSALMYIPKNATNDTPAPGIMMYHGGSGNGRNHEAWAMEYARRGYVVIAVDNLGSGNSEYNGRDRYAICDLFTRYLYDCPIVDNTKIILSGHSIGGDFTQEMGLRFQPALTIVSDGGGKEFNTERQLEHAYLVVAGTADKACPEGKYEDTISKQFANDGVLARGETVEQNVVYGSIEEGNAHKFVRIKDQIHEGVFVNSKHIAAILDFSQQIVSPVKYIDAENQVWFWKDALGLIGMFVFVAFMLNLALMLIDQMPVLAELKQPLPRNVGLRGVGLAISIVMALVFPLIVLYTGGFGLINALGGARNLADTVFRVRFAHYAVVIVAELNLFGLLMFFLYMATDGRKAHANLRDLGLTAEGKTKIQWSMVGKAFLVAAFSVFTGFTYMKMQDDILGTDFYCLFFGFKDIELKKFVYYIPYLLIWIPSFAIAAVGMNVERRLPSTGNEKLDDVIAVLFNGLLATASITVMVIIENAVQIHMGSTQGAALPNWGTDITRIWGMPVGMFLAGTGNTYAYRKTGNIWLGAFLMGIICCLAACLYGQTYPLGAFSIG